MYVIIVGCGRVGSELAKILSKEGHDVVIIDKNQNAFLRLGETFNGVTICGNGFGLEILKSSGIEKADAFCALTNGDNTNLMAAQVAKKIFGVPRVIARVYDPQRAAVFQSFGLDIISGTVLIAAMVRDKIIEPRFSSYLIETGDLGVMRIEVKEELIDKKVENINIPGEFLVITIIRKGKPFLPQLDSVVKEQDVLMGIVKTSSLEKIKNRFGI